MSAARGCCSPAGRRLRCLSSGTVQLNKTVINRAVLSSLQKRHLLFPVLRICYHISIDCILSVSQAYPNPNIIGLKNMKGKE
jgi:hypothetical protein